MSIDVFALSLALKQRFGATRKWPIGAYCIFPVVQLIIIFYYDGQTQNK